MYAAVRQYEMGAGSVADFMRAVDEGFADALAQQPGFHGYHVVASGSDEIVAVTLFEDEDSAAWSDEVAAEFVRERLQQFQLNLTSSMGGVVGVSRAASETLQTPPA